MAGSYKNFMKLLEAWPLDKSKAGRDLGQHIRDNLKVAFAKGPHSEINQEQCDRYYNSLKRLASNYYGQHYPRTNKSTASGLSAEECNIALSPEFEEYFKEEELGILKRNFVRLKKRYGSTASEKN
ncbi:ubiquinol-cytochrome-c reductase complex assembly factor 2 [Venturia canescens]|uniref:ubiquinol-cytochrome-c reductase complex assembly factor 2 n=1 Tax=Venturia canescens TaxID=32260 RepID=UPI001C9C3DDC|nr:ubiquinol-cytochrome-c reductase complex assembly factor 2 [Venturia canescens]